MMNATTLLRFLFGSRDAILTVAGNRASLWIGALFVLSAGLAREYDGEDLFHEPWHALRPLGASLASGSILFVILLRATVRPRKTEEGLRPSIGSQYLAFMGVFWMTAPLAWLYAIPYERWLTPYGAVQVNLWTLALVAAWRVVLMVRVVQVLYGIRKRYAFFLVMAFADAVTLAASILAPMPLIDIMGGIRHNERDQLIAAVTITVQLLTGLTLPIWWLGALISMVKLTPKWPVLPAPTSSRSLGFVSVLSLVAFVPLLLWAQPEQMQRREAEQLLRLGRVREAFELMSSRAPSDYPPQWNPPPNIAYGETFPDMELIQIELLTEAPADWVVQKYVDKVRWQLQRALIHGFDKDKTWSDRVDAFVDLGLAIDSVISIELLLQYDPTLSDQDRQSLERLYRYHHVGGPHNDGWHRFY